MSYINKRCLYNSETDEFIPEDEINKIINLYEIHYYETQINNLENRIKTFFKDYPSFFDNKKYDTFIERINETRMLFKQQNEKINEIRMEKIKDFETKKKIYIKTYEPYVTYSKNIEKLETKKRLIEDKEFNENKKQIRLNSINDTIQKELEIFQCSCIHNYTTQNYTSGYERYKDCMVCNKVLFVREIHP